MHVLYVHQNFPAQFGHIARHLVDEAEVAVHLRQPDAGGHRDGIEKIQYKLGRRRDQAQPLLLPDVREHRLALRRRLPRPQARPDIKPDLIVGHSGFGSTLFLRELYPDVPIINFFEYYYRPHDPDSDMDFRKDLGWEVPEIKYLRSRCRNAMILLDLQNCQMGYTPTEFQRSRFPDEYRRSCG